MGTLRETEGYSRAPPRSGGTQGTEGTKGTKDRPPAAEPPARSQPSAAGSRGGTKILWQLGHCITRVRRMISMYIWGGIRM
ncbi:MAG: hypothetical protein Kow0054_20160 [Deferrisoma sp.]